MPGTLAVPGYRPNRNGMYATPVVEGNTVVPVVSPPRSMTQRERFGRSPRPSSSRSTSTRAPSMSTRTALILSTNVRQESGPGIRRGRRRSPPTTPLLDLDGDLHAESQMWRAIALVGPLGRVGKRHVVRLVRLRQERSGEIVDGVLHAGVEGRRAARRKRIRPERDVVRTARDVRKAYRCARGDRDRVRLEGRAGAAVAGHLDFDDGAGRRRGGGRCRGRGRT